MGPKRNARLTIGRARFAKVSKVEGIHLSHEMRERFDSFDRRKLTPEARRKAIIAHYKREPAK